MVTTTTTSQNGTNGTHEIVPAQLPFAPRFTMAEPTKEDLDYADLPIIDLLEAKANPAKVAEQVRDAMTTKGFLYIVNHGYTPEQMQRMHDISNVSFDQVPEEQKEAFDAKAQESGSWQGYKLRKYWELEGGVRDQIEMYSINKDVTRRPHPDALQPFMPEIDAFARHNYSDVVHPMLRLLALGMELPENTFVDMHDWNRVSESFGKFSPHPHTEEDDAKANGIWFQGHTDFGSITLLYSQPVSALQILADGKWKWVKHLENAIIMNAGDSLEFLSGGFYKATIHRRNNRVIKPPADQRKATRLGCFFFVLVDDHVKLAPAASSPVLQRVGITRRLGYADEDAPTMKDWRRSRTLAYGADTKKDGTESKSKVIGEAKVTEEVINGVVVKHYA
ncbi:Clavaminate synthase-like protein [Marasmius fiardii PR-910]|nr:Clavaminate synthase-like protein [Marasmius fiardii PR-910]